MNPMDHVADFEGAKPMPGYRGTRPIEGGAASPDEDPNKKDKKPLPKKVLAFGGAIVATVALATGIGIHNNSVKATETLNVPVAEETVDTNTSDTSAETADNSTETANGSATETEQSQEQLIASLEIPTGLDTETLANTIVADRLTKWLNAGAEDSLLDDSMKANEGWATYLPKVAQENADVYTQALFVDDWEQHTDLVQEANNDQSFNLGVLQRYVNTAWNSDAHPENKEAFKTWFTIDSVSEGDTGTNRTLSIKCTYHNNSGMNDVTDEKPETKYTYTITVSDVNGTEKISAMYEIAGQY